MKLEGLKSLYGSMKSQGIERYKFDYKVGKAVFDVFFFIDSSPFILLFGARGQNFSFELEIKAGFTIDTQMEPVTYRQLCRILDLEYDPTQPFSPRKFFGEFDTKIPHKASIDLIAKPHDIAPYRHIAEESDKIYYRSWLDNDIRGNHVKEKNLDKTRKLLGEVAYLRCKDKNISSCWTDRADKAVEMVLP
jgi:hypothetical protein